MSDFITNPNFREKSVFIIGRVVSVILGPWDPDWTGPSDLGKIRYQTLYSPSGKRRAKQISDSGNKPAYPMWGFLKHYPIVNEIVVITTGPSSGLNDFYSSQQLYYFSPYNMWNDSNHNAFPDLVDYKNQINAAANEPENAGSSVTSSLYLGYTFKEKEIRNLQPFEGDIIMQARFGQSIRFGSTVPVLKKSNTWSNVGENGSPITIITNEAGSRNFGKDVFGAQIDKFDFAVEDINKDGSSIYLTSDQQINLEDLNNFPLDSFKVQIDPVQQVILEAPLPFPISNFGNSAADQDRTALSNNNPTTDSSTVLNNQNQFKPDSD